MSLTTKLPRAYYDKLNRLSAATGQTKVDYIANLIIKDLDTIDIDEVEGQDPLPMSA